MSDQDQEREARQQGEMEMAAMQCFQTPWQKVSPAFRAAYEHAWEAALAAREESQGEEFLLWSNHTWTGVGFEPQPPIKAGEYIRAVPKSHAAAREERVEPSPLIHPLTGRYARAAAEEPEDAVVLADEKAITPEQVANLDELLSIPVGEEDVIDLREDTERPDALEALRRIAAHAGEPCRNEREMAQLIVAIESYALDAVQDAEQESKR